MEWLRSHIKQPRTLISVNLEGECDPQACYDSFRGHWQQTEIVINCTERPLGHDDIRSVVIHLEQMTTLLLYDIRKLEPNCEPALTSKCLEFMRRENILRRLFSWGRNVEEFTNAILCAQLKLYEMLISKSRHVLLVYEEFVQPLLQLLDTCHDALLSQDIECMLVDLLKNLSALLVQHTNLASLFFQKTSQHGPQVASSRFVIFSLLVPYVHRDDAIGMRARDALLLCMSLSKLNIEVAQNIEDHANFCVLAATGLNGLYSALPVVLTDITSPDWHRLTADDVNDINGLSTFVASLEFCNGVAQVAHPIITKQLHEYLYRGFLMPVLGPALFQKSVEEQIAATVYLELIVRTAGEPTGLLNSIVTFLLNMQYENAHLLENLIERLASEDKQLCLVSLSLFETLVDLNSEQLMFELVFRHLKPLCHSILSHRRIALPSDPHCHTFVKLLALSPNCCTTLPSSHKQYCSTVGRIQNSVESQNSLYGKYNVYLYDARTKIAICQKACSSWTNGYTVTYDDTISSTDDSSSNLPSLDESSGYESLKMKSDDEMVPLWQVPSANNRKCSKSIGHVIDDGNRYADITEQREFTNGNSSIGPFLTALFNKLEHFLSNSIYINFHVTGLISRLAVYPQPILRTYLLECNLPHSLPVPSLFQIVRILSQNIDHYMGERIDGGAALIEYGRDFLLDRESRIMNVRRCARHQITMSLGNNSNIAGGQLANWKYEEDHHRLREVNNFLIYPNFDEAEHVALCTILLDEWVKELAALAQEHTVAHFAAIFR